MARYNLNDYALKAREASREGIVMIKNDNNVLPLTGKHSVAVFGRTQFNYYKSGTGSGGLVNTRYVTGIYEALKADENFSINETVRNTYEEWVENHPFDVGQGWAQEPWFQEEMKLSDELVANAAKESDTAIIIVGRTAGEDKDNKTEQGSYLLTDVEMDMLRKVCGAFERSVVLLNVGNTIDMKWVNEVNPSSVLYVWQGGQEGGNGVLDVLNGTVSPSGRLTDTISINAEDHLASKYHGDPVRNIYVEDIYVGYRYFETFAKDKVMYPFGYGLSYTTFTRTLTEVSEEKDSLTFTVEVKNTGDYKAKDAVLVFVSAPQGSLGKAARVLCGFAKTKELAPGEIQNITISCDKYSLASYDDCGATGHKNCYVLEAGDYEFFIGGDVREAKYVSKWNVSALLVLDELSETMAPVMDYKRLKPQKNGDSFVEAYEDAPRRTGTMNDSRNAGIPAEIPYTGDKGYKLSDVKNGTVTMEQFVAQFEEEDLLAVVRGEGMSPSGVTPGIAGAFGGVSQRLKDFGVPKAGCSDGPSGIRMDCGTKAFAMPNGTCLACSFNEELSEELYEFEGMELRKNHIDTLLGPGMNIHRNPLNGRNFEYFSEDPYVTGKMAAAQIRGMQKYGVTGTIKHFACNNQEFKRSMVDSVVSERALREIYLKGYEIAVKEAGAFLIMTSYNRINDMHAASNYDLLTTILRGEWKFDGTVMTDWWAQANDEGGESRMTHVAAMVRAQNDLFMVMPDAGLPTAKDTSKEELSAGRVTKAEYQRSAMNICNTLMKLPAYGFFMGEETELDKELAAVADEEMDDMDAMHIVDESDEAGVFYLEDIDTSKGKNNLYQLNSGGGVYKMILECCAEGGNALAQIPLSIFKEFTLLKTITLTGDETEWQTIEIDLQHVLSTTFFVRLFFGQGGMKIRSCKVVRVMNQEQMMKMIEEYRNSGTPF